jgi:hypothetical protein
MTSDNVGIGHCGKHCRNWVCDEEPKWDDLCVGCPCNPEENSEFWEDEYYEDEYLEEEEDSESK